MHKNRNKSIIMKALALALTLAILLGMMPLNTLADQEITLTDEEVKSVILVDEQFDDNLFIVIFFRFIIKINFLANI